MENKSDTDKSELKEQIRHHFVSAFQDGFEGARNPNYQSRHDLHTDAVLALITQQCKESEDELLLTLRRCRDLTEENQRLEARLRQQCNQARIALLNDLKQVTFNAVMGEKDAHGAIEDYIAAELAQAKETEEE